MQHGMSGGHRGPNGRISNVPPRDSDAWYAHVNTTAGNFVIEINPSWSPIGAQHFLDLVESGFYDGQKVFRVIPNFLVQFGYNGDPAVNSRVMSTKIKDDRFRVSNFRGYVAFAGNAKNSRGTNVFINLVDNFFIDHRDVWATPFGRIDSEGMKVVESFYSQYNSLPPNQQPDQGKIGQYGNDYLNDVFPELTEITSIRAATARPSISHQEL